MPTKTRIANKTQWAIMDIINDARAASLGLGKEIDRAISRTDPALANRLASIRQRILHIEQLGTMALRGEYEGDRALGEGSDEPDSDWFDGLNVGGPSKKAR